MAMEKLSRDSHFCCCLALGLSPMPGCLLRQLLSLWMVLGAPQKYRAVLALEEGLPDIQPFWFPSDLKEGSSARVLCGLLRGKKPVSFSWFKNGEPLTESSPHVSVSHEQAFSVLTVDTVEASDSGNYTCLAENSLGFSGHSALLTVKAAPEWVVSPSDTSAIRGARITLYCSASGLPRPRVTWFRAGDVIGRVAPGNGTLLIDGLQQEDAGRYSCAADNGVGSPITKEISIRVLGTQINCTRGGKGVFRDSFVVVAVVVSM